jgi:hypothetical protein
VETIRSVGAWNEPTFSARLERSAAPAMLGANGEYLGPMVTWEVITERLETERKVRESNERERKHTEELRAKVDEMLAAVRSVKAQIAQSRPEALGAAPASPAPQPPPSSPGARPGLTPVPLRPDTRSSPKLCGGPVRCDTNTRHCIASS